MPIKAVIFDLDGTITKPYFDFDAIRQEIGLEPDGLPILEAMENMSDKEKLRVDELLHRHEKKAVERSILNPGVRETLEKIHDKQMQIGILTRNRRMNAIGIAEKHKLNFDAIVDREDGPVKPDAFGVLELCRKFNVKPHETIVVGDYLFDVLCANAAGATSVLLANHHNAKNFTQHADFTIEKIDQILEIIEKKNNE